MKQEQLNFGFQEVTITKKPKNYCNTVRETIQYYSVDQTSLQDLLAVIIGSKATPALCQQLSSLSIKELTEKSTTEFQTEFGLSLPVSMTLVAAIGLAKKIAYRTGTEEKTIIRSPEDIAKLMIPKMRDLTQEHFVCIALNTKNHVIGEETIFIGTLNSSLVHLREVFKNALKRSSASIICVHNPSGSVEPSREDITITERLVEGGKILGIDVLDHLIIGEGNYCSLKSRGLI